MALVATVAAVGRVVNYSMAVGERGSNCFTGRWELQRQEGCTVVMKKECSRGFSYSRMQGKVCSVSKMAVMEAGRLWQ